MKPEQTFWEEAVLVNFTKEFLYQKYVIENCTTEQLALELDVSKYSIKAKLRRYGIRKIPLKLGNEIYDNKDWLYDQYITQQKGYTTIALELGVSYTTILDRILFFGWELRGHKDIDKGKPRRGKKHSPESIIKIRKSRIKNRVVSNCFFCNKPFERVYSTFNRSEKSFCSNECFRQYLKENRVIPNDITDSAEYKEWRKKVYARDSYRCQMPGCNSKTKSIAAHHIYPKRSFPEKQFDLNNGITLCKKCHERTYGKENEFIDVLVRIVQKMND